MSLPDLQGTFYPDISRSYQAELLEFGKFSLYKGETFTGDLIIDNNGTENAEAFDVDLYISPDGLIDTSDRYLGTYTVPGIAADSFYVAWLDPNHAVIATLPKSDDSFWENSDIYYLGAIIDPNNTILESNENNNISQPVVDFNYFENFNLTSKPISVEEADLPVVTFNQDGSQLQINLSEAAPEEGFTINYINFKREDYINGVEIPSHSYWQFGYGYGYLGDRFYDPELNRLYVTKESYYDLRDYKYYDANGGHYDPVEDKYFNVDGSYYDLAELLFYDVDGNETELTDNSAEDSETLSPRHYLSTGAYISLTSGIFYDAYGGYIYR